MNNMIKGITIFILVTIIGPSLLNAASRKPYIIKIDKKRLHVDSITADEKGDLKYKIRAMTAGLKKKQYIYAYIPMPKEIMEAKRKYNSKKYQDAIEAFDKAYNSYRWLGWGSVCIYYSAKSLDSLGKKTEAAAKTALLNEMPVNPKEMEFFLKSKQLEADILISEKKYEAAKKVLNYLSKGDNKESAMFANNAKGDILSSQGKESEALFIYLRNIILFHPDKSKESIKAINKTAKILKEQGNPRAEEFEAMK